MRITKEEWTALGGLRNPRLYRKQYPSGRWGYYKMKGAEEWRSKRRS